jgi:DNA-binding transcriptional ArsR family regulator
MVNSQPSLQRTFQALGDPTRRAIVERLARADATLSDLAEPFAMSLPAIHKHVRVLEEAGLVRGERRGRTRLCRLDPRPLRGAASWIDRHRALWERRLDALARHLDPGRPT